MRLRVVTASLLLAFAGQAPAQSAPAFKHVVIVFQENRTPDNLFGSNPTFEPGVDIATSGVTSRGKTVALGPVAMDGCYDIAHTHAAFEYALNLGFDAEPLDISSCTQALPPDPHFKYVDNSTGEVQPYFDIAKANGFANRMFQTNQGPSFPAHQFIFSGTSSPAPGGDLFAAENMAIGSPNFKGNNAGCIGPSGQTVAIIDAAGSETQHRPLYPCFEHQTLGDVLSAAKPALSWRYYAPMPGSIWTAPDAIRHICQARNVGGVPTCTGAEWTANVVSDNPAQVLTDISGCNLPNVSWVIPTAAESDHAAINNGSGPQWVASIVNAVGNQTCPGGEAYWTDTVVLIAWDDWGGWYDHVKPFEVNTNQNSWGSGYTYGFRVPLLVVSAYTNPGTVSNDVFDFGSILYFVEQNFGVGFIGPGTTTFSQYADYHAAKPPFGNLASFFNRTTPKPFGQIPTTMSAKDFLRAKPSIVGPDND